MVIQAIRLIDHRLHNQTSKAITGIPTAHLLKHVGFPLVSRGLNREPLRIFQATVNLGSMPYG